MATAFGSRSCLALGLVVLGCAWAVSSPAREPGASVPADREQQFFFDFPAMPLDAALERFGTQTGWSVLYRGALTAGRQANPVAGRYSADTGLRMLIEGTGVMARRSGPGRVVLLPAAVMAAPAPPGVPAHLAYYGQAQRALREAFCGSPMLSPGQYRAALALDIAPDGQVRRARLLDTTQDAERDALIERTLDGLHLAPPPPGMAQPVTLLILPRESERQDDCPSGATPAPAMPEDAHG